MAKKQEKTLEDLFEDGLKDVYFAEKKILQGLKKMAKAAESEESVTAFENHYAETETQIERLEQVFELLEQKPKGKNCPAILGILEEGEEIMKEYKGSPALDAGLIAAAQAVEHYEMTRYGALKAWAKELGMKEAARLLDQNLSEEIKTDKLLTTMAEGQANQRAEAA